MKKIFYTLLFMCTIGISIAGAQTVPMGMNYQAVARDMQGYPLSEQEVFLKISFTSADEVPAVFFQEKHKVVTDKLGLFNLVIGEGVEANNKNLLNVPWEKEAIWMEIALGDAENGPYHVISSAQVLAVPYAMHAQVAKELAPSNELEARNQNINWATSGNSDTRPPIHFIGTRDNRDVVIKTNNVERLTFTAGGQQKFTAGVDGNDDDINAYPLKISGGSQGIYIKVRGSRNGDNNFLAFADDSQIWGRVEGQTASEWYKSSTFIRTTAFAAAKAAVVALKVGAGFAKAAGLAASVFGAGAAPFEAVNAAQLAIDGVNVAATYAEYFASALINIGVSYSSGNGDYTEYLLRDSTCNALYAGDVVGVKGGIVSLNTEEADHFMVISTAPIVLGNTPQPAKKHLYEKVAFMGQVFVKVAGPVKQGDYILPSGNNDGLGLAISPDKMMFGDYPRVLGVAWESGDALINIVNVAVGINTKDLSVKTAELNARVDNIMDFLEGKAPLMKEAEDYVVLEGTKIKDSQAHEFKRLVTDADFERILTENESLFKATFEKAQQVLIKKGIQSAKSPEMEVIVKDPVAYLKALRKSNEFETQWHLIDQKLKDLLDD